MHRNRRRIRRQIARFGRRIREREVIATRTRERGSRATARTTEERRAPRAFGSVLPVRSVGVGSGLEQLVRGTAVHVWRHMTPGKRRQLSEKA
jgi:hypothetical protein